MWPVAPSPGRPYQTLVCVEMQAATAGRLGTPAAADEARAAVGSRMAALARPMPAASRLLSRVDSFMVRLPRLGR